ncbi:hypothetical protein F9L16_17645 [Agarivorans sp. B2Z047]|uniref:hypothetical protein n=1 Tax=Agarivorans sp. B2Z047 TaxID=2652721 RepID=UPI00128B291B|nr:hypothetical protein [Agarivorans sp. B2Z047]MPW30813.1 hypothetical protein [Agarivorans sp. B2Z047]UQN40957.1 porin family protein [Agarivorans sp. B2Z047]
MKKILVLFFILSSNCFGEVSNDSWYVRGSVGGYIGKTDREFGANGAGAAMLSLDDSLYLGFGVSGLALNRDINISPELYIRPRLFLDDNYYLYSDVGYRHAGERLFAGLGALYQLSDNWSFDFGYRWYKKPISGQQGDLYGFNLGLQYRLSGGPEVYSSNSIPVNSDAGGGIDDDYLDPEESAQSKIAVQDTEQCSNTTPATQAMLQAPRRLTNIISGRCFDDYSHCSNIRTEGLDELETQAFFVNKGATLSHIAREYCLSLDAIIHFNPMLVEGSRDLNLIYADEVLILPIIN